MKKSASSKRWLARQEKDPYTLAAREKGYRSRAAFKLLEIQEKYHFIVPGMTIVDLGAAPGGWAVIAKGLVGDGGKVYALDILPMDPIAHVEFIQGDFTEQPILEQLMASLNGATVDVVISDMAPNLSGINAVDQPRAMYLAELALDFAMQVLPPDGAFLTKAFQGEGFDDYLKTLRQTFNSVVIRKPKASRASSRELYLLGRGVARNTQ